MRAILRALAVLSLVVPAGASAFVTSVSLTQALSDAADSNILCPSGSPLGGGFDSAAIGVLTARGTGVFEPAAPLDPLERWAVQLLNPSGMFQDYRVAAVCGSLPGLSYVFEDMTTIAGLSTSENVVCPLGKVAVGGGALTLSGIDARLTATGPYFPGNPLGPQLSDQPDGEAGTPGGWRVSQQNVGVATTGVVFALCASNVDLRPIVESQTVQPGQARVAVSDCPPGMAAIGGGFDAQDRTGLRLAASSPLFEGFPFRDGIFDLTTSTNEDAIAWRVVVRNESASAKTFQVVAMCVPEPRGVLLGVIAAGTLALVRRARVGA
jgi:hypothetical protein